MNKRVLGFMGMLFLGYLIKVFGENFLKIINWLSGLMIANPAVLTCFIGGIVIIGTLLILYGMVKMFLKWQSLDSQDPGRRDKKG